ncbi:12577_t:CDS:10 [Acaulospora morrowiae]|uniref:RNA helicase n=1 Tax=Acaulospora morrowiae TaxID=94023 RepID=A0A9N9G6Q2_9GLOM|nr:12577_t:CDS:10 [Acaulospora morrowiae]
MDLFRILGTGAKFNKKRFNEDIGLFEPTSTQETKDPDSQTNLIQEIDFFHNSKRATDEVLGTKHTKTEEQIVNFSEDQIAQSNSDENEKEHKSSFIRSNEIAIHEDVKVFRKRHQIRVYGTDIPDPLRSFSELETKYDFQSYIIRNLESMAYDQPTPIQMQVVPTMLHGRDIMAMAPTGSGKTLAYILPILHDLKGPEKVGYRALIISPTRELEQQIYRDFKRMSVGKSYKICTLTRVTAATQSQDPRLRKKFDILISTPLRLVRAIQQENIDLKNVRHLILDEADKLLELGFLEQTDEIFAACANPKLQKSLFSATLPSGVETLANSFMKDPIRVVIGLKNAATDTIKQKLVYVGQEEGKLIAIRQLIQQGGLKPPVLIFVQSIERAKELFHELIYDGINVDVIHSERTKAQRDAVVLSFRQGKIWVLISTELMARGMDFKGVNLVINYDFPQSVQSYIHRIGRTGRAGKSGEAVTFYTKDDAPYLKIIVNVMKDSGCEVPDWMLKLKNPTKESKHQLRKKPIKRKTIDTRSYYDIKKIKRKREIIEASKRRKARKLSTSAKEKSTMTNEKS